MMRLRYNRRGWFYWAYDILGPGNRKQEVWCGPFVVAKAAARHARCLGLIQ